MITSLLAIIIGFGLGYFYRDVLNRIKKLESQKPNTGVTAGSYKLVNEIGLGNQAGDTGLVQPKTPQQLEFEENERLKAAQFEVNVKPKN